MGIKNKIVLIGGLRYDGNEELKQERINFECIITNDRNGKTLSINDGKIQFTIPFEPIEKYLK